MRDTHPQCVAAGSYLPNFLSFNVAGAEGREEEGKVIKNVQPHRLLIAINVKQGQESWKIISTPTTLRSQ